MVEEKPNAVQFREGEYLSITEAGEVVRASPTSIVVVAGAAGSGKTTLVAGLYELFHKRPFGGYLFAGSRTLPGFERRCHLARLSSGRQTPDTERTRHSEEQQLLHLRVAEVSPLRHYEILFSDIYGEAFRRAADSADECRKFTILKRADHVAVLIDGKKAISKSERQVAFSAADALLGQCLDTGMLGKKSSVQAIVTKWDLVATASNADANFIDGKLDWLLDRYRARLGRMTAHKVSVRPANSAEQIKAGHGMAVLLPSWVKISATSCELPQTTANVEYYSEFDRLASCRPLSLGGGLV